MNKVEKGKLLLFMLAKEDFLFIYYETIECLKFRFM